MTAAVGAVAFGAAVAIAAPASAQPIEGTYFVAAEELQDGGFEWTFTSCGPDCITERPGNELRRQGASWVGITNAGCRTTIDENSLAGTYSCPMAPVIAIQLSKVG